MPGKATERTLPKSSTVLNLIQYMEKLIAILKNARFSGKVRQSLHILYTL